jgi:predicted transcriptional regulator
MKPAQVDVDFDAIYEAVDRHRRQLGIRRMEVADALGVSPSVLTRIDQGGIWTAKTLLRAMVWLNRDVRDFAKPTANVKPIRQPGKG